MHFYCDSATIDINTAVLNVVTKDSCNDNEITEELPLTLGTDGKSLYAIIYLPPKDIDNITISSTVTAKTLDGVEISVTDIPDVTVPAYIESLKELAETNEECAKALALVNSLEAYCDYADKYFDESVTSVEEIILDENEEDDIKELYTPAKTSNVIGDLRFVSTSLILESEVTLRHYFEIDRGVDLKRL